MPFIHITGELINLHCKEPFSPEFPDLHTATNPDDGIVYFDASEYLEAKQRPNLSVDAFFHHFNFIHVSLTRIWELDPKKVVRVDPNNHILIDASFAYIFLCYVEPDFLSYCFLKIAEMFEEGVALSDTYIASQARQHLSKEVLIALVESDGGSDPEDSNQQLESETVQG